MGRGYVFGLLAGALFSSAGVGALSLMLPPVALTLPPEAPETAEAPAPEAPAPVPEAPVVAETAPVAEPAAPAAEPAAEPAAVPAPEPDAPEAAAPIAEPAPAAPTAPETPAAPAPEAVASAPAPVAPPAPEPTPPETAAADTAPATAAAPDQVAAAAPLPEAPVVDVPAGSEFNRPKPEEDPVVPAPQPAPAATAAPTVSEPQAEAAPALTERTPAAAPERQTAAPVALPEPAPAAPEPVAEAPVGETAVPVPPPGEAVAPDLGPAPGDEIAMTEDDAPGPIEVDEPDAGAGLPAAGRLPQIIAPEPSQPDAGAEAPGDPAAEAEAVADAAIRPRFVTPGARSAGADGPVIIDVAPQAPIGAAAGPRIGFQKVPGVQINRLPNVAGAAPDAADAPDAAALQPQGDRAVERYAAAFDNPEGKPLIAVILIDNGAAGGVDPDSVAAIGAPVTIAINPESAGAAARAQTYRLSGDEIAILAPALPAGATPSDVEVAYQGIVQMLPESVALMADTDSALQGDRRLAQHMAALLGAEGRALVTYAKGLNPARQAAERAGVPYAGITRSLEEAGQDDAAMQRLLDRAAFDAARTGTVLIVGQATPVTVSALTGWIAAGQKAAVIGPLSAAVGR